MAESDLQLLTELCYHSREGLHGTVLRIANENLRKFVNDPLLQLFSGYAQVYSGEVQEGMRTLDGVRTHPDLSLAALNGLLEAHKRARSMDKEAMIQLEQAIRDARRENQEKLHYYGGLFLSLSGKYDKAKEHIEKCLKMTPTNPQYLCLRGWNELMGGRDNKSALQSFDESINELGSGTRFTDPWLGRSSYHKLRQNPGGMIETLTKALGSAPNFLPLHIEKMRAHFMARDWDQAMDTAQRCFVIYEDCIEAHKLQILHRICFEGQYQEAATLIGEMMPALEQSEGKNHLLYLNLGQVFSRVCGRSLPILQHTKTLCEKSVAILKAADNQTELGRQYRMAKQWKQSIRAYKEAMELESTSSDAMLGIIHCYLAEGNISEAEAQLDFAKASGQSSDGSTDISYLDALIMKKKNGPRAEILKKFRALIDKHFATVNTISFGSEYFLKLDPDFVLELANVEFDFIGNDPPKNENLADPQLKEISRILNVVTEAVPGLSEGLYLTGKAKYLSAQMDAAKTLLQQCLAKDQTYSDAHLLMAQIHLQKGHFKQASQSLEVGLSFNFEVREHPIYHLIKARILKRSNNIDAAVTQLTNAMNLPGFRRPPPGTVEAKKSKLALTEADRVGIYLELIDSYQILEKNREATSLMEEAMAEFAGAKEEERLLICNADLALNRGDIDKALALLKAVTPDQPNYLPARQKMAEIYLHHKKDKRQFAICYKELVEKNPTPEAFVLLGDAYMSIQEPERAIEVYEAAMKKNPKDHALARKIGQAYVRAHLYNKAVNYYEAALKTGQQMFLRLDLAELLFRLKNFEKCERILKVGLEKQKEGTLDIPGLIEEVKFLELLSKLYFETGNWEQAVQTLMTAKDQQLRIIKKSPGEISDMPEQKKFATKICSQLGEFYENQRELDKAIGFYKEALGVTESDRKVLLSLAHLYMMNGDLDEANQYCQLLLRLDKDNDQATLMLADLMYQRNQTDAAMFHFQQLLDRNPNQWHALARLVELTWRNGEIDDGEKYIKAAVEKVPRAALEAGFNYCQGLSEWFTGDPNGALQHFNRARRDLEWGERAIYNMIEICLNPDNEIIGSEVFDQGDSADSSGSDRQDSKEMGVRTAERFLKELRFKPGLDYKYRLMENFILLATKNKSNIDQALENFLEMGGGETEQEVHNVGAVLGTARAYMIQKQTPRAKAQLKRVLGHPWNLEDADYLEQCWLLLADTYINQGKYDVASEILRTCLQHNASCTKAFEYLGFIREKEQKWAEAAINYEQAWKLSKRRNPTIGYKLGYNYLKSKRLVNAIDACHRVLELFPNYPKIRREILDRARANLRM